MARTGHHFTNGIDQHVALIKETLDKSMHDGHVRELAVKIVSGTQDYARDARSQKSVPIIRAFGKQFAAPPGRQCASRDEACEIERIWDFCVLNFRYVYDPADVDFFTTAKASLLAGGGDCFPCDSTVQRGDGLMVPIESIQPLQTLFDGHQFVQVLKTWTRGLKPIYKLQLSNGKALRLSDTHKVLRIPNDWTTAGKPPLMVEEVRVHDLHLGDRLLQPKPTGQHGDFAAIQAIDIEGDGSCVDVMTTSGRVYLPDADVIVRQCDDAVILIGSLAGFLGFKVLARVIATKDAPEDFVHIYPMIGLSKDDPRRWVPLDITVQGAVPGWEYPDIAAYKDYEMV